MMIDIFQYSNMYTLRKSIQWLADESHVKEECGPYVTKKGPLSWLSDEQGIYPNGPQVEIYLTGQSFYTCILG